MRKVLLIAPILVSVLFCSCRTIREVPVQMDRIIHDTIRINRIQKDTTIVRDSVYVNGETVYKQKIVYRKSVVHDTLRIHLRDSIPVPVEVTKTVVKPIPIHVRVFSFLGKFLLVAGLIYYVTKRSGIRIFKED